MVEEPQEPRDEPARLEAAELRDRIGATDDREHAVVGIAERFGHLARESCTNHARRVTSLLHRDGREPGQRVAVRALEVREVAEHEDLGMPWDREIGADDDAAFREARAGSALEHARTRPRPHTRRPQDRRGAKQLLLLLLTVRALLYGPYTQLTGTDRRHHESRAHFDAEAHERSRSGRREFVGKRRQHTVRRFDEHDARAPRVDAPEVVAQRVARELRQRAGELDPRRPAADHHEGEQLGPLFGVWIAFGAFECAEDLRADARRVLEVLQARRVLCPVGVVPEVRGLRTGRDDERVVRDRFAVGEHHDTALSVPTLNTSAPVQPAQSGPSERGRSLANLTHDVEVTNGHRLALCEGRAGATRVVCERGTNDAAS